MSHSTAAGRSPRGTTGDSAASGRVTPGRARSACRCGSWPHSARFRAARGGARPFRIVRIRSIVRTLRGSMVAHGGSGSPMGQGRGVHGRQQRIHLLPTRDRLSVGSPRLGRTPRPVGRRVLRPGEPARRRPIRRPPPQPDRRPSVLRADPDDRNPGAVRRARRLAPSRDRTRDRDPAGDRSAVHRAVRAERLPEHRARSHRPGARRVERPHDLQPVPRAGARSAGERPPAADRDRLAAADRRRCRVPARGRGARPVAAAAHGARHPGGGQRGDDPAGRLRTGRARRRCGRGARCADGDRAAGDDATAVASASASSGRRLAQPAHRHRARRGRSGDRAVRRHRDRRGRRW